MQYASIYAYTTDRQLIGWTWLTSPAPNAPWSIMVSAINSDVTFDVSVSDNDAWFYRDYLSPISVYNQDTSGINLNLGDMKTITMNGTISVTYKGQRVPYVNIYARTRDGGFGSLGWTELSSPANGASWSITMEVPASAENVYFEVKGCDKKYLSRNDAWFYRDYLSPVSVYNQDISGININLGDITNYEEDENDRDINYYTLNIQIDPNNATAYHNRGFAYYNNGDYDLAIADYTQAIRIDPNNAVTYNNRGASYNNKGDYDRAITDLDQAIRLDQNFANPYRHRAFAYLKKGNYRQARADVNKALQINPDYQSAQELSAELQRLGY